MMLLAPGHVDWLMLRQALSLSLLSGKPFALKGGFSFVRDNPAYGSVLSDFENFFNEHGMGRFEIQGGDLAFHPGGCPFGTYRFAANPYSSCGELFLLLLPALSSREFRSRLLLRGVTHAQFTPSIGFIKETFLEMAERSGFYASCVLKRFGFYGSGGGDIEARIYPAEKKPWNIPVRVESPQFAGARVYVAGQDTGPADRQRLLLGELLDIPHGSVGIIQIVDADGPGNFVEIYCSAGEIPFVFSGMVPLFDESGGAVDAEGSAEATMRAVASECRAFLDGGTVPERVLREIIPLAALSGGEIDVPPAYSLARETLRMTAEFVSPLIGM